jgi:hypothetical protein
MVGLVQRATSALAIAQDLRDCENRADAADRVARRDEIASADRRARVHLAPRVPVRSFVTHAADGVRAPCLTRYS